MTCQDDYCLICPLPRCDENDPRCAYRQTEEFQRIRRLRLAQKKRAYDRQHGKAPTDDALHYRCKSLWLEGLDTYQIAERIGVPENLVYNELL